MRSWLKIFISRRKEQAKRIQESLFRLTLVQFSYNVAKTLGRDYVGIMAAGLSYYAFLSLFPLISGLIAILGFLLPSESIYQIIVDVLRQNIPASTEIIESTIMSVIELRGQLGLIGIVGLLFGGTAVFSAMSLAINRAWNLFPRSFIFRKPIEIAMVLFVGLIIILLFGISTALSLLGTVAVPGIGMFLSVLARIISFLFTLVIFLLIYKYIPNFRVYWGDIWRGALLGAVMFQLALFAFTYFLNNFAAYELIYGSLASLIAILIWIYISSFILILCAEINVVYNSMFRQGKRK